MLLLLLLLLLFADAAQGELEVPGRLAIAGARAQRAAEGVGRLTELALGLLVILFVRRRVTLAIEGEAEVVIGVGAQIRVPAAGLGRPQERFARLVEAPLFEQGEAAVELHAGLLGELARGAIVRRERALMIALAHRAVAVFDVAVLRQEGIPGARGRGPRERHREAGEDQDQISCSLHDVSTSDHAASLARGGRATPSLRRLRRPIQASGNKLSRSRKKNAGKSTRA